MVTSETNNIGNDLDHATSANTGVYLEPTAPVEGYPFVLDTSPPYVIRSSNEYDEEAEADSWLRSEEAHRRISEAEEDIDAGNFATFHNVEDLIEALHS